LIALSELLIYPVKSCAGISLTGVELDRFGPAGDRRWLVVNEHNQFLSQRELPAMALIHVATHPGTVVLSAAGSSCTGAVPAGGENLLVTIWDDEVLATDAGAQAATWLTQTLGRACRLVYMPQESQRLVDPEFARAGETVSFADGFPLLLISQASLDELNRRLEQPVPMDRFRPNLVVTGCEPHAEDNWQQIRIGETVFDVAKPCARCVMPSIIQATGEKDPTILRALASYRRGATRHTYFGQNLPYRGTGQLRLGDTVEVLA